MVIVDGVLKRDIYPPTKASATVSGAVGDWNYFWPVGESINTCQEVGGPLRGGRGPTKSMWTMSKRASGVLNVPRDVIVCRCTFDCWHCWHDWAHFRMLD